MKYLSKLTIGYGIFIILSASFMSQLRQILINTFGEEPVKITFLLLCSLIAISFIVYIYKKRLHIFRIILSISIITLAYFLISEQPYFTEKIHVLEYSILGYLALRDFSKKDKKDLKDILWAFLFISAIGSLDEIFQKFLPYRVGEIRDVATNVVSGLLGIALYFVCYRNIKQGIFDEK